MKVIEAYTDGATSNNGATNAVGGWAYLIFVPTDGDLVREVCNGHLDSTTNNQCELTGVIECCKRLDHWRAKYPDARFIIYSDSAYIINCYAQKWYEKWQSNGWVNSKKQAVANRELWKQLIPYFNDSSFDFRKVAGHAGIEANELVDTLARAAKEAKNLCSTL